MTKSTTTKSTEEEHSQSIAKSSKRKRSGRHDEAEVGVDDDNTKRKKKRKHRDDDEEGAQNEERIEDTQKRRKKEKRKKVKGDKKKARNTEKPVSEEPGSAEASESGRRKGKKKKKKSPEAESHDEDDDDSRTVDMEIREEKNPSKTPKSGGITKDKKSKDKKATDAETAKEGGHLTILQKLRKSLATAAALKAAPPDELSGIDENATEAISAEGLQHLPQPAPAPITAAPISAFASLPSWLRAPTTILPSTTTPFAEIPGLSPKLLSKLEAQNITSAFAVQTAVLPLLLDPRAEGDVLISAATGSGKTLSYVLPIVQALLPRVVTRLRALIVVPTRELVQQVAATTTALISGSGLKLGVASGQKALAAEQELLVRRDDEEDGGKFWSKVDILITTPGRLVEHVRTTPGFDLTYLKWLVIDEADRLLAQSFQEWVDVVVGGLERAKEDAKVVKIGHVVLNEIGMRPVRDYARKVVLSATMTRDVGKLADLRLRRPMMVVVADPPLPTDADVPDNSHEGTNAGELEEQFSVPAGLREHVTPIEKLELKPLSLLYLLRAQTITTGALVFVKTNEGAARLAKLLQSVAAKDTHKSMPWHIGLVTGEMEKKRREKVLRRFARGKIDLLICSDLISRGLDLPAVRHIVNYDIPASTRAYIHRVGRTARAGKEGDAWTLLSDKEARWFWSAIGKNVRRLKAVGKVPVEVEAEGTGLRGVYEGVLYGEKYG